MFTGLIEVTGVVRDAERTGEALRIAVESDLPVAEMADGESVAVDGVCLTVVGRSGNRLWADVIPETLACTTLGAMQPGDLANLERSLRLGDRLGGHLVQGHVDAVAEILSVATGQDYRLRIGLDGSIERYVAFKGSIALGGVSLTVAACGPGWAEVALIPETLSRTNLGRLGVGDRLNVEVDLIARYLEGLSRGHQRSAEPSTPRGTGD